MKFAKDEVYRKMPLLTAKYPNENCCLVFADKMHLLDNNRINIAFKLQQRRKQTKEVQFRFILVFFNCFRFLGGVAHKEQWEWE